MLKKILFVVFACVSIIGATAGANALTVSYDCGTSNGTAPTDSANYNSGDVVTVKPNTCTVPSGKHFAGYVCGSTNVAAGNTFTITENTTCTAQYENGKFAVKTTNTTTVLNFKMSATGTFTVDCGDNGVLTDDAETTTVSGNTIIRSNTTAVTYTCTWTNASAHTIAFDGTGTGYSTEETVPALLFYISQENTAKIASISGNLYNLLPSTGTASGQIPRFYLSFAFARNLTSIPGDLFNGYTRGIQSMFLSTFSNCYGLTSLPADLFATFTIGAVKIFQSTFQACNGLTSIPSTLFASFASGYNNMFYQTFYSCVGLTSLPDRLFASFTSGGMYMFRRTFMHCTHLSGYIPPNLFAGLIANNSIYRTDMMADIFYNTNLATSCDSYTGMTRYVTPYDSYLGGKVSCATANTGYTITYACGSGSGIAPVDTNQYASTAITVTVSENTCTPPTNMGLIGWSCNGNMIAAGGTFTISSNTTCTAQWDDALTVTYTCGDGGGTAPTGTVYASGATVITADNTCTAPSGKAFGGWSCGNMFTITENTTCTAQWFTPKFSVTTNDSTKTFFFSLTARGTFMVDCGDNGVLTDDATTTTVSNGNTITRTNTTNVTYECHWANAGSHTVSFDGTGTGYNTSYNPATISFSANGYGDAQSSKIALISGSLYNLFPPTGTGNGQIPSFYYTFYGASALTSIPSTLFDGYTVARSYMFAYTFRSCTGLIIIPDDLFESFTTGENYMFCNTFNGCTGLTSLSGDLFKNITNSAQYMFDGTFIGCTGLTSIPDDLFASFSTGATYMFRSTFYKCTGLRSIPADLFKNITTSADGLFNGTFQACTSLTTIPSGLFRSFSTGAYAMFNITFQNCSGLTTIPGDLFASFTSGAATMFNYTFRGCTGLTSLPDNLFASFTSGNGNMFKATFNGCTNLSGYIPPTLFGGLIANNATYQSQMMESIFDGTSLATSCDSYNGTTRYITPYDSYWSSKVSCGAPINCTAGQYLPARTTTCATCTANNYCPSGSYGMNITDQGLTACSSVGDNSYTISDAGATADTQCYKTCTIAHATTVTGNDYYGAGVDTCVATACEDGYSVSSDICTGNIITINWNGATAAAIAANNAGTAVYGGDIRTPQSVDPSQIPAGKHFVGWKFRKTPQG